MCRQKQNAQCACCHSQERNQQHFAGPDLIGNETAADIAKQREPSLDRSQCRGERDRSSQDTCRIRCEVVEGKRENIIAEGNETDDPYCRQFEHFSDAPEGNFFAFFYLIILDRQERQNAHQDGQYGIEYDDIFHTLCLILHLPRADSECNDSRHGHQRSCDASAAFKETEGFSLVSGAGQDTNRFHAGRPEREQRADAPKRIQADECRKVQRQ